MGEVIPWIAMIGGGAVVGGMLGVFLVVAIRDIGWKPVVVIVAAALLLTVAALAFGLGVEAVTNG